MNCEIGNGGENLIAQGGDREGAERGGGATSRSRTAKPDRYVGTAPDHTVFDNWIAVSKKVVNLNPALASLFRRCLIGCADPRICIGEQGSGCFTGCVGEEQFATGGRRNRRYPGHGVAVFLVAIFG